MSTMRLFLICLLTVTLAPTSVVHAQGTAFIYQGLLKGGTASADGSYDMMFNTYATATNGTPLTTAIGLTNVNVGNGLFTVYLDFGAGVFTGDARWLEIAVRPTGSPDAYTILAPRQPMAPTPYAIAAGTLNGILPAGSIVGAYTNGVKFNNPANSFTGDGSGLTGLNANNIAGGMLSVNRGGTGASTPSDARTSLGAAASGANADITSLSALTTALSVAQGGTGADTSSDALANLGAASLSTSNTFSGVNTLSNAANRFVGTFTGEGSGLTGLNANNIAAGTVPDSQLAGTYSSALNFNNAANSFVGGFVGNGSGLANVDALQLGGLTASEFWQLGGNAGTTAGLDFLGTSDEEPLEFRVDGMRALRIEPSTNGTPNLIGGSPANSIATDIVGATIAGGGAIDYLGSAYTNRVSADFGTVSGGYGNASTGVGAAVGGGNGNVSGGLFATVPGGSNNLAMADYSLAAGMRARATDSGAFVWADATEADFTSTAANQFLIRAAGGVGVNTNNPAGKALAVNGDVGISGDHTLEFGADRAGKHPDAGKIGYEILTPGALDIVGAGTDAFNRRIKFWAERGATFNGMGSNPLLTLNNIVDEPTAMVFAAPFSSWRVGQNKPPDAPGSFDAFFIYQQNAGATRLLITDDGKVGLGTNSPVYPLHLGNGAYCTAGGVWTSVSDRSAKTAFAPVNPQTVLAKLAKLPVSQWRYKVEDADVKHIGPTAQDFHAAFGLGESSLAIGSIDADGVALAAIQGLIGLLNEREAENRALMTRTQELEERLNALESAMAHSHSLWSEPKP